jgi:hypothetical protein
MSAKEKGPLTGEVSEPNSSPSTTPDASEILQNIPDAQAEIAAMLRDGVSPSEAILAELDREYLRLEVIDAAAEALNYLMAIRGLTASDDMIGLPHCARQFIDYARVVARGCKLLTGGGAP